MATDIVTLWNLALSAAGARGSISAEDETGREADLCRLWYPLIRDNALKAASWPCAKTYRALGLLATRDFNATWVNTDPSPTWKYAYQAPSDLLAPRYLTTYAPFQRAFYTDQNVNSIDTNQKQAVLHYIFRQEDVTKWDSGLENTVVSSLAAQICLPLNGKVTRARELLANANEAVLIAQTEIANESDEIYEELPEWIAARGYEELPRATRFVYPYAQLLGISA